jgi:TolB protein
MDAASGETRLLSSDTVVAFFWSPDGDKILTISVPKQDGLGKQYEVNNQKDRRLARLSPSTAPQPVQMHRHTFQINVIDVESGEGRHLIETALSPIFMTQFIPYFDQYARSHQLWSPDSSAFVLPIVTERISDITVVDARNGRTTSLTEGSIAFWSRQ